MNFVRTKVRDAAVGVAVADDPASLQAFLHPGCAAAVWRRQTPPSIQSWLDGLDPEVLPRGRVVLPSNAVSKTIGHLFDMAGLPEGPSRDWLHSDIVSLAGAFANLLNAKYLRA